MNRRFDIGVFPYVDCSDAEVRGRCARFLERTADYNDQATLVADLTVQGSGAPVPFQNVGLSLGAQARS